MRILVLNQYFHPDGAASAQLLTQLTTDLAVSHEVWIVTGRPSYNVTEPPTPTRSLISHDRLGDVHVVRVWSTSFSRTSMFGRLANYLSFLTMSVVGAFRTPKPDVVMAWTDPPPITAVGALVARLRHAPFVLVCQDIVPGSVVAAGELSNPLLIRALETMAQAGLRGANKVVAIGDDMADRLVTSGVPRNKVAVIRNWSDGAAIYPSTEPNAFRHEHGWDGRFVVMHSGNLGMGQDLDALIDAAAELRSDDLVIAIIGEGIRKRRYQEAASRMGLTNVVFLPFQPEARLRDSLGAADVHLVAHRRGMEGFQVPSKLYGILAAGKACLAAVAPGSEVAETVLDAGCGIVVDPDDGGAIADAIRRLRDQDLEELGRRARTVFESQFDRPIAAAAYQAVLEGTEGPRP